MWKKVGIIVAALTLIATIAGAGMKAQEVNERIPPKEITDKAVEFFGEYDADQVIAAATKEYIMDSIEEVNTQIRWQQQQKINAMLVGQLKTVDSLLRLNIQISDKTNKKIDNE